ncbi:MAG: lipoprotein signal peptidase [Gammaproteobacteria bacterium]|nr:lipoprotein signal peptidase [Gammaproteobacteria bacterium]
MRRSFVIWLVLAALLLGLDQWTKNIASVSLDYNSPVAVLPFFNLTLLHNTGAAFSFLNNAGGWQRWLFAGLAIVVSTILVSWLYRLPSRDRLLGVSLSLLLAGALGNLWDRLTLGYVVDFIELYYGSYHFPAFNVADSAITVGAILLILDTLRGKAAT